MDIGHLYLLTDLNLGKKNKTFLCFHDKEWFCNMEVAPTAVRVLPTHWEIEMLSTWRITFQRNGSQVPEKDSLHYKIGKRSLKRFSS